jgi:disulfide bond formation protein DsbB
MNNNTDAYAVRVFWIALLVCVGALGFAYYLQHYKFLDPCPWCIVQRIVFFLVGILALIGLLHRPGATAAKIYAVIGALIAAAGTAAAAYQIWLQQDAQRAAACMGSPLERLLDTLQIGKLWYGMLQYDGSCALAPWDLLGFSIPEWSCAWLLVLAAMFITVLVRQR